MDDLDMGREGMDGKASAETMVTICDDGQGRKIRVAPGQSLLDALVRAGYDVHPVCGGRGRCGKCGVRVVRGTARVCKRDREVFSPSELEAGWRLSCLLYPQQDLTVALETGGEDAFSVLTEGRGLTDAPAGGAVHPAEDTEFDAAVDIGTTTLALALFGAGSGRQYAAVSRMNSQRRFGADVISRIQASTEGKGTMLRESIRADLCAGLAQLAERAGIAQTQLRRIVIACNTTMGHLLMGYDCSLLGCYPFRAVNLDFVTGSAEEIIGRPFGGAAVTLLPGISVFVGGDIVSGLLSCGFDRERDPCLLIDLGTNGEMALGNRDAVLAASAAAGPAFEAGNITWGTGSVPGAICGVAIDGDGMRVRTIGGKPPVGICGTGVIEAAAELRKAGIVEASGLLDEAYFEQGFPLAETDRGEMIVLTQRDIRQLQLAKAAVRAGMETLFLRYGLAKRQIKKVYLAGGFGYRLNPEKAVGIGLLPEEFSGRIEAVGNSSLSGAAQYLRGGQEGRVRRIVEMAREIPLAEDEDFNRLYLDAMMFDGDV